MENLEVFVQRGKIIESVHKAKCLVKDSKLRILFSTNHDDNYIFPRSSIKIFQALPLIISEAHTKFNLNQEKLAIACSSHIGEKRHLRIVNDWISKLGLKNSILKCGIHLPIDGKSSQNLLLQGKLPTELHNNCSGKHLGMVSGCIANKFSIKNYIDFNHPYQKLIRNSLEFFAESKINKNQVGIDGCSAPQYAFKMENLADSMVRLVDKKNNIYFKHTDLLLSSISKYPYLIGGSGRFDSQIIEITKGRLFCKGGAEGVLLFSDRIKKIGGVIKIIDGNERAIPLIAIKIFNKLKLLNQNEISKLKNYNNNKIFNHADIETGKFILK